MKFSATQITSQQEFQRFRFCRQDGKHPKTERLSGQVSDSFVEEQRR